MKSLGIFGVNQKIWAPLALVALITGCGTTGGQGSDQGLDSAGVVRAEAQQGVQDCESAAALNSTAVQGQTVPDPAVLQETTAQSTGQEAQYGTVAYGYVTANGRNYLNIFLGKNPGVVCGSAADGGMVNDTWVNLTLSANLTDRPAPVQAQAGTYWASRTLPNGPAPGYRVYAVFGRIGASVHNLIEAPADAGAATIVQIQNKPEGDLQIHLSLHQGTKNFLGGTFTAVHCSELDMKL
jgi:hypothetical protein